MRIHRAADVHHQDDAGIAPAGRARDDLDLTGVRGRRVDGRLKIELIFGALTDKSAELSEGDLNLPCIKREVVSEPAVHPGVRDLHRAPSAALSADADALWRLARMPKRARAAGADPFISAVVPLGLLLKPLFEEAFELFEIERFDEFPLLIA